MDFNEIFCTVRNMLRRKYLYLHEDPYVCVCGGKHSTRLKKLRMDTEKMCADKYKAKEGVICFC